MATTQSGSATRDAIDLLMDDHKRVQKLFKEFEDVDRDDEEAVRELVETACVELQIHSLLEEEIFYPAVRSQADENDPAQQDLLNEAEVEHEMADEIIARLQELEPDDAMYAAYFNVLAEYVRHHVREEEKELFPAVKNMEGLDLQQLAQDMRARREELFAEMESDETESEEETDETDETDETSAAGETAILEEDEGTEDELEQIDANVPKTRH